MATKNILVVFVHGWSVTNTDTYGGLPRRLSTEASKVGLTIEIKEIHLGKYVSFRDEVEIKDIARAFDAAVIQNLIPLLNDDRRFVCITHSTGGPVIREWWHNYYINNKDNKVCPMSHLIMLAPANFGSALAQLGKSRIARMKFWLGDTEPGQGVLDWLELGSEPAWRLNTEWIRHSRGEVGARNVFLFVLTGQTIDRTFYDNLNNYTGEIGSDGVVRVCAANLCSQYIRLTQEPPADGGADGLEKKSELVVEEYVVSAPTAFRVLEGKSHSGSNLGIMRSVHKGGNDPKSTATINSIIDAIRVSNEQEYDKLTEMWRTETSDVQIKEKTEHETKVLKDRFFIHDRFSMVVFRVRDETGQLIDDFDLLLTTGTETKDDPNKLPEGFLKDRQKNSKTPGLITYYFNYDLLRGDKEVVYSYKSKGSRKEKTKILREERPGIESLGLTVVAEPKDGFVHYTSCEIRASKDLLEKALKPNSTTLIDIKLNRAVHNNIFALEPFSKSEKTDFKNIKPSNQIVP